MINEVFTLRRRMKANGLRLCLNQEEETRASHEIVLEHTHTHAHKPHTSTQTHTMKLVHDDRFDSFQIGR